jgi:hypothetical protein
MTIKPFVAILFAVIATTALNGFAQGEKPQNIYRVTVNSRYVIENGERTSKFYAIGQLISDSLGRMHTEIDYTWETRYPDNYRWHYFDGQTKVKTDFFFKEKLNHIETYSYNSNNQLQELKLLSVSEGDTTLVVREEYSYDTNGLLIRTTGFNNKGKRGFRARHKYDANGSEVERRVRGKRAIPADSIVFLKRIVEYDSLQRKINELVEIEKYGRPRGKTHYFYKYDNSGNLVEEVVKGINDAMIARKEFVYRRDNRIQGMRLYNSTGELIDYQAWRYEIYKTPNRTHRILE